ncbi:MAG TPA: peroxiredoxin family protein [Methanocella sp.]|nr:peroxiredoxin family protein [Methanocella sp.]
MYSSRNAVDVGSIAPGFKARDVRGEAFDMAVFTGRSNLVIFFYRDSQCRTCREELKSIAGMYDYITQLGGEVVAVTTDSIDETKNLAVDLRLPYRMISDPEHRIIDTYGVFDSSTGKAHPVVFILGKNRIVRLRKHLEGLDDLLPAADIVNRLLDMTTGKSTPFMSSRYK